MARKHSRSVARFLILALFSCGAVDAQLPGGGISSSPLVELQKGIQLLRKGEHVLAKAHFRRMQEKQPHATMPPYYIAVACAALGETDECLAALRVAIECGWEKPEEWRQDPGFARLRTEGEEFSTGLEALLTARKERRDEGKIAALDLSSLAFTDPFGSEHVIGESRGAPLALLFIRSGGEDLTALWAFMELVKAKGTALRVQILVECRGKGTVAKLDDLNRFRDENAIDLPIGLASIEQRRQLRPWHSFPTLVLLDGKNVTTHVVDGFPPDIEARYSRALGGEVPALSPKPAGPEKVGRKKDESGVDPSGPGY